MTGRLLTWRTPRMAALWTAAVVLVVSAGFYRMADPPLTGDEPHYVAYAKSLGRGWGLDLQRVYELENRHSFYPGAIDPHAGWFAGPDGRFASWHGIGLPLLLAPLAAMDPPVWMLRLAMIALAAALAYHLYLFVRRLTRAGPFMTAAGVAVVMLSPPVIYYSGQVYPELLAALLVVLALRSLWSERPPVVRFTGAAIAAALLPWLNVRYITLTAALALLVLTCLCRLAMSGEHRERALASAAAWARWPLLAGAALGAALVAFNLSLYGSLVPLGGEGLSGAYFQAKNLYIYGLGGILGVPSGILPLAPVLIVGLVAIPRTAGRVGTLETAALVALGALYFFVNAYFGSPGFSPPGRYLVSALPLLAVPLTVAIMTSGPVARTLAIAALGLTAVSTVASAQHFQELYTSERRNIQPIFATRAWWPATYYPGMHPVTEPIQEASSITHSDVGLLEEIGGLPYLVARDGRDAAGPLVFGPYVTLHPGRYRTTFELLLGPGESGDPAVGMDVNVDHKRIAESSLSMSVQETVPVMATLDFSTDGLGLAEFRVWFGGDGVVGVGRISTQALELYEFRGNRGEWWKAAVWIAGLLAAAFGWRREGRGKSDDPDHVQRPSDDA